MKELEIIVKGQTASGKSSIIHLLKNFLKHNGFDVEFDGSQDFENVEQFDEFMDNNCSKALNAIRPILKIKMIEAQEIREKEV